MSVQLFYADTPQDSILFLPLLFYAVGYATTKSLILLMKNGFVEFSIHI